MNIYAIIFLSINIAALLFFPRRWAPLPLLVGACYMTLGQGVEIGPFRFTIIRILVLAGLVRVAIRWERISGGMNGMDWLMLLWSIWALVSSVFHYNFSDALINRLGLVYNACGIYFLLRVFCQTLDDVNLLCRITAILLVPVAFAMIYEKLTVHNLFSIFGGIREAPAIRVDRIRAQGPFAHPILAGTIGAVTLPLIIALWWQHRTEAIFGIAACLVMIFASASTGPIMSATAAIGALWMWRYRHQMRFVRWAAVFGYIGLDLIMNAPAYYLIARANVVGGSTGYHRARLIQSAFQHLHEWWLAGTDYTRHWMVTGVSWSPDHSDITNHYLQLGVVGGLPLMLLFIAILAKGFSFVGQALRNAGNIFPKYLFMVWALGATLFAHAVNMISVSYFDQSFLFVYLTLASIGLAWSFIIKTHCINEKGDKVTVPVSLKK